ncbi:MAG: DeoR family transcriptional regulator [Ligilactobacillus ruminis]|nr:DeoR family transcriptional regulator [Ligilactobacillus ruminis]
MVSYARNVKRTNQHQSFNIANEFNVTPKTVRNDLKMLEEKGLVIMTFGLASLNPSAEKKHSQKKDKL